MLPDIATRESVYSVVEFEFGSVCLPLLMLYEPVGEGPAFETVMSHNDVHEWTRSTDSDI